MLLTLAKKLWKNKENVISSVQIMKKKKQEQAEQKLEEEFYNIAREMKEDK